ncbi:hypothetical protein AUP68_07007 [Ilyonectria robusta]
MAGPSRHGTATVPATATVLDFICLFTHDLKRKQKRWQDGVLKYHTFNKRIMVSDDRGHFIGDAHWQAEAHLETGDEFELDRGSAIVQVSDCTGQREQDLTELLDKRARDVEKRRANAISRTPRSSTSAVSTPAQDQSSHFQLRHRPLASLVGASPRIGRAAISPHSPYEARQLAQKAEQLEPSDEPPPPKRRKQERSPPSKSYHARSLFGAALTLSPFVTSSPTAQSQVLRDKTNTKTKAPLLSARNPHQKPQTPISSQPEPSLQQPVEIQSSPISPMAEPRRSPEANKKRSKDVSDSTVKPKESSYCLHSDDSNLDTSENPTSIPITPASQSTLAPLSTGTKFQPKMRPGAPPPLRATKEQTRRHESIVSGDERGNGSTSSNPSTAQKLKDATKPLPNEQDPVRSINEPRTELRIRSRQRRGLLVISEKHGRDQKAGKHLGTTVDKGVESHSSLESGHVGQGNGMRNVEEPTCTTGQSRSKNAPIETNKRQNEAATNVIEVGSHGLKDDTPNDSAPQVILDSSPEVELESPQTSETQQQDDAARDQASSLTKTARHLRDRGSRKEVARHSTSDEEPVAIALSPVPNASDRIQASRVTNSSSSGPRITKMARKSVKSREIIGFVIPSDGPTMTAHRVAAPTLVASNKVGRSPVGNIGSEAESESHLDATPKPPQVQLDCITAVAQCASTSSDDKSTAKPTPRLSNPATRGKKAAKREDAAGHLPQTMIQLDPVLSTRVGAPKPPPSAKSSGLPGFSKANGGAWSRHAEDLLGMTRPADKASRR